MDKIDTSISVMDYLCDGTLLCIDMTTTINNKYLDIPIVQNLDMS